MVAVKLQGLEVPRRTSGIQKLTCWTSWEQTKAPKNAEFMETSSLLAPTASLSLATAYCLFEHE
jgi:hypothetical protein